MSIPAEVLQATSKVLQGRECTGRQAASTGKLEDPHYHGESCEYSKQ